MDLRLLGYFVAVCEERHVGRAAARLHMTQPPLSRAIHQLESELGVELLLRTPRGVEPTPAGEVLAGEARALLAHADRLRGRVATAAGAATLVVGTLADTAEQLGAGLVAAFRARHPHVEVAIHETDLGDPTAGLRAGLVDVALTRTPFDAAGLATRTLRSESVGVVLHADDPLAGGRGVSTDELADRRWVRLPPGADATWRAYWSVGDGDADDDAPPCRTIQECLQSVLWNGAAALAPLGQALPPGLVLVPVRDREPTDLVVAWRRADAGALVRSFVRTATERA